MPTEIEYREMVQNLDHAQLVDLWRGIQQGDTPRWAPGKALEYAVLRAFELEGARITWPFSVELGGEEVEQIDGVIYAEDLICLVESKHYNKRINIEPIAKLRNQLARRPSTAIGLVFSYNGFTEPARLLTRYLAPQTILLWDLNDIDYALKNRQMIVGLNAKFRYAVEHGVPDYSLLGGQ